MLITHAKEIYLKLEEIVAGAREEGYMPGTESFVAYGSGKKQKPTKSAGEAKPNLRLLLNQKYSFHCEN